MDVMDTFIGKSLSCIFTQQISSKHILSSSGYKKAVGWSLSQDRRMGLDASYDILSGKAFELLNKMYFVGHSTLAIVHWKYHA